ncbi:MAG: hypothetical protein IKF82_07460 [Bacilli bacterium]|nr:hypothetical protein [Bacilli bacterium]
MSRLLLYNYNNYFNRIVKKENSIADYGTPIYDLGNCNFNPNDGVTASHIINYDKEDGDYVLITDDEKTTIISRWFVTETVRMRGNQYRINLKRDLIVDNFDKVINSPIIINRAMINNPDSPLLFNPEGFSFNQIKKEEILLKDRTLTPWYILYFNKNVTNKSGVFGTTPANYDVALNVDIDSEASPYKSGTYSYLDNTSYKINYNGHPNQILPVALGSKYASFDIFKGTLDHYANYTDNYHNFNWFYDNPAKIFYADDSWVADKFRSGFTSSMKATMDTKLQLEYSGTFIDSAKYEALTKTKSLVVKTTVSGVTKYYQVNIAITSNRNQKYIESGDLYDYILTQINAISGLYHNEVEGKTIETNCELYTITVATTEISSVTGGLTWQLNFAEHTDTKDAPYHIVAIPRYNINIISNYDSGGWAFLCPQSNNEALVNSIIAEYGTEGAELVDVQLIPYFPFENRVPNIGSEMGDDFVSSLELEPDSTLAKGAAKTWSSGQEGYDAFQYSLFGQHDSEQCAALFYIDKASFSFDISKSIIVKERTSNAALNKKLSNELDLFRLCSPNYNGIFEYSNAKNNGTNKFNVDITLRPFNPYIHVNPDFKGLYGIDFNDKRGLICQGDFSLPMINDQWKTYELNNKNYLNTFNRQIEHMDFVFGQERITGAASAIAGTFGGAIGGGAAGAMLGNPIAGAIGGGVASGIGGIADYAMLEARQNENKSLAIDNFKYQLGNIKALPHTVNKITCLTENNKIWPFIEIYEASEEEATILQNKITYTSMSVEAIGYIQDYIMEEQKQFLSGKLIRLEELNLNSHEAFEIFNEIEKGVYI